MKGTAMLSTLIILALAAIHLYFTYLECIAWEAPRTRAIFGMSAEKAAGTKAMAVNQGTYNAFLGVGLLWGLVFGNPGMITFLLLCIVVAGAVGAATGVTKALYFQTAPAAAALVLGLIGL